VNEEITTGLEITVLRQRMYRPTVWEWLLVEELFEKPPVPDHGLTVASTGMFCELAFGQQEVQAISNAHGMAWTFDGDGVPYSRNRRERRILKSLGDRIEKMVREFEHQYGDAYLDGWDKDEWNEEFWKFISRPKLKSQREPSTHSVLRA